MRILEANVDDIGLGGVYGLVRNIIINKNSDDVIDIAAYEPFENPDNVKELAAYGTTVHFIGHLGNKIVKQFRIFGNMKRLVRTGAYDCVHIHSDIANKLLILGLAAKCGGARRIILHSHASDVDGGHRALKKFFHVACRSFLPCVATDYMSCSDLATKWMFPSVSPSSVRMLNNGVDLKKFAFNDEVRCSVRSQLGLQDKYIIGHVGRFAYQKNHDFLLRMFAVLRSRCPKAHLLLVGVGDLMDDMKSLASDLAISDDVTFYGASSKVNEMFQAMDVFVLPSHFEGLPIVGVEAQAAGLPVVFSDKISRESKITDPVSFLPISSDCVDMWVDKILELDGYPKCDTSTRMDESGFSILGTVRTLMSYYKNGK